MSKIVALGNCPSSGSTFLADLLDSSPISACGPELNLFSLEYLYNGQRFKDILHETSRFSSIYLRRNGLVLNDLSAYGLNKKKLESQLQKHKNLESFLRWFSESFLALRGKKLSGVVFEKSPQNLHCIKNYLETLDSFFIHIVRNPVDVYLSLLRRGFSNSVALITWLLDEAKIDLFLDHPRFLLLRYEDLINDPYRITSSIIEKVTGRSVDPKVIEYEYGHNNYRSYHTVKLKSWKSKSYGKVTKSIGRSLSKKDLLALSSLKNLQVNEKYAKYFDLNNSSFEALIKKFGYLDEYLNIIGDREEKLVFSKSEKYKLFRKFTGDFKHGDAKPLDFMTYLNPV